MADSPGQPDDRRDLAALAADVRAYARYLGQIGDEYLSDGPRTAAPPPVVDDAPVQTVTAAAAPVSLDLFDTGRRFPIAPAPPPVAGPSGESLEAIRAELGDCARCKLAGGRTHLVYGEGSPNARLMFVGEGPGADEDATGRPFVGAAGKLLDRIIEAIGLTREQVYIANVVKCRPPDNRKPERDETATCEPFLFRQIAAIAPSVLVLLGNTPVESLLGIKGGITRLRGTFHEFRGIKVMPTFHPAYLLRDPSKKREVWEDMKKVRAELDVRA